MRALEKRGILSLFPIQLAVFKPASEGRDLIGRAKTGSGKTLAFALPVVENLLEVRSPAAVVQLHVRPPCYSMLTIRMHAPSCHTHSRHTHAHNAQRPARAHAHAHTHSWQGAHTQSWQGRHTHTQGACAHAHTAGRARLPRLLHLSIPTGKQGDQAQGRPLSPLHCARPYT